MAGFCTKCGAPLSSTTGFCNACGTPIVAAAAPQPTVVATPPVAGAPPVAAGYPTQNAYPPAKSSGGALKVILIIVAVVVVIGLIGVGIVGYGAWKVSHAIQLNNNNGKGATVSLPGLGSFSAGGAPVSEADLGVPLYPGATIGEGGMHMTMPTGSMVTAVYLTSDPVTSVVAFYKGKLGANESDIDTANGSVLSSGTDGPNGKAGTEITVAPGSGNNSGKTQIVIVHTTSTSSQ